MRFSAYYNKAGEEEETGRDKATEEEVEELRNRAFGSMSGGQVISLRSAHRARAICPSSPAECEAQ